jgi:ribosome biogenesis GTPase
MITSSGVRPVVVLNKVDLARDLQASLSEVQRIAGDAPVLPLSALSGDLTAVERYLAAAETAVLLGSSGVGKTTLVNRLTGGASRTSEVRPRDDRGRHTTTRRELFRLPSGALLIDSPGVREVQPWSPEEGLDITFADIEALAADCRFRDCTHDDEPGCAVRAATEDGHLDPSRLTHLTALRREAEALALRRDEHAKRRADRETGRSHKRIQAEKRRRK